MSEFIKKFIFNKQEFDLSNFSNGVERKDLDAKFWTLFDKVDTNHNKTLDKQELSIFLAEVAQGDNEITDLEANQYLKDKGVENENSSLINKFLLKILNPNKELINKIYSLYLIGCTDDDVTKKAYKNKLQEMSAEELTQELTKHIGNDNESNQKSLYNTYISQTINDLQSNPDYQRMVFKDQFNRETTYVYDKNGKIKGAYSKNEFRTYNNAKDSEGVAYDLQTLEFKYTFKQDGTPTNNNVLKETKTFPDGSSEVTYADGRIAIYDKQGKFIEVNRTELLADGTLTRTKVTDDESFKELQDLRYNPNYSRSISKDIFGHAITEVYNKGTQIGEISDSFNKVIIYDDASSGTAYTLQHEKIYSFTIDKNGNEIRTFDDGLKQIYDKKNNTLKTYKDNKLVREEFDEGNDDKKRVIKDYERNTISRIDALQNGIVTDFNGNYKCKFKIEVDENLTELYRVIEYPDRTEVVVNKSAVGKLNEKQKATIQQATVNYIEHDIQQALSIVEDYKAGKGVLGWCSQGLVKLADEVSDEDLKAKYQNLLNKIKTLKGLSGKEFENAYQKAFGQPFDYAGMTALQDINGKLQEYSRLQLAATEVDKFLTVSNVESTFGADKANGATDEIFANNLFKGVKDKTYWTQAYKVLYACFGDANVAAQYLAEIFNQNPNEENAKNALKKALTEIKSKLQENINTISGGKSAEEFSNMAAEIYKKAYGIKDSDFANKLVNSYMTLSSYLETGITIAASLVTMGSASLVGGLTTACVKRFGQTVGTRVAQLVMVAINASTPAALTVAEDATSQRGITNETYANAFEKFENNLMYGTLGSFISAPLGNLVSKQLTMSSNIVKKVVETGVETSADVVIDKLITGMSVKESLAQNGVMNYTMMFLGGRVGKMQAKALDKKIKKNLHNLKITKSGDEYAITFNGQQLGRFKSAEEATAFLALKSYETAEQALNNVLKNGEIASTTDEAVVTAKKKHAEPEFTVIDNNTANITETSPKSTTPQAAPQDKEVQGVRAEKSGKKAYEKPEIADIEDVLPADIAQYLKSVAKNSILKNAGITPDVADKMRIETLGTYGSLLPSTLKMIEHFENKLAKSEKITPDDIYQAIQEFDSYWATPGYGSKFQEIQRDLISKYWKNADKDFADKFNVAMTRSPEIMELRANVAKNSALKQAGITPDVADKMRIETLGTYGSLLPSTLKMIEHFETKLAKGEKITPDDIYQAIQEFDSYWATPGYGSKFQEIQRDLISKYWKNADKDFADKFNIAMTRTPEIMEFRTGVAQNSALKNGGITPDIATQMLRETSSTYGSLLPSTLKMIEHFENKLAKGEKITPDDIYNAIQKFDSYWAEGGYGDKFQNLQRDLISKYWKNADKDFADKFNVAMTRTPEIMEFRTSVAQNSALKNGGITPDIATQMLRETSGTYGALVPRTLDMISYMQAKIESGAKLSSILVNEAFNKFNKEYTQAGYGTEFQNLQRDLISKYWKNAGENFGKIYDVAKNLDIDTPVQKIRTEYKNAFDVIDKNVRAMGLDKIGKMSIRLKGQQSLHDKIANYLIDHPGATVADAVKDVRDAIGARTVVESGDFKNHPEVKALLDAGKEREAILRAAELQSAPAVDALKAEILKQAETGDAYSIARVSNYVAKDGIPYFSEAQLADLKQFAANHGVKLKINLRIDPSDPNFSKVDENYKPTTKSQPSGYTALQANFTTKDGKTIEWQFRGDKVNEFAEGEHIPYDLRTGKDIIGEHKELEVLYNPIKDMLSEKNMEKETYKEYNRYLGDYYTHLRKLELGFDSVEPKLEDYGNGFKFDERLSAKNLIALHEAADKIKNRVLSVKDAMEEYNSKISINRIEKFAGSVQPYTDLVIKNREKIKELNKIQDMEEFCKQSFELIKNEMGLKDSGVKLAFAKGNEGGYYDLETNTVYVNVNWNGTKCVEGQGNKAEIFGDIAHELTHHIQWIEIMRNGWFEDDLGSAYKQQLLKSKEGKYIYNYASKIGANNNSFETSMNQLFNWLNYKEPYKKGQNGFVSDRNGNPIVDENSLEYKEYINQPVEKDAFEKGEAVVKKYKELID